MNLAGGEGKMSKLTSKTVVAIFKDLFSVENSCRQSWQP